MSSSGLVEIINKAYSEGMSDAEVAELLHMSMKQFNKRLESDDLFREWVEMGRTKAEAWWMRKGRASLNDGKLNTNLWMFVVKNRFDWAEKLEQKSQGSQPDSLAEIKKKMLKVVEKARSGKATDAEIVELVSYRQGSDGT